MSSIHWLVQSVNDCPGLADGIAPAGLLCGYEQAKLAELKLLKRRRDWLLGRWTAKRLLQSVFTTLDTTVDGSPLPLNSILIDNDPDGAPYAAWAGPEMDLGGMVGEQQRMPVSLSISHSNGVAFCAVADWRQMPGVTVGVDLEHVEPRELSFVSDFFAPAEIELVRALARPAYDWTVTTIWSAKEAVLKALREGLRIDTRAVVCLVDPTQTLREEWTPFTIQFADRLMHPAAHRGEWSGWHRRSDEYPEFILTMVVQRETAEN